MSYSPVSIAYHLGFLGGVDTEDLDESDLAQARQHVIGTLGATDEINSRYEQEVRLRLALHLCPQEAMNHDPMRPESRKSLIEAYMVEELGFDGESPQVRQIAQRVATLIQQWEAGSSGGATWQFNELYRRQEQRCANCRAPLDSEPVTMTTGDVYKPYSRRRDPTAEVDHIEAASRFGDDCLDNLQLLCQLCNRAKSNDLTIPVTTEFRHAATPIENIPESYRARMLFHVIHQSGSECARCGSSDRELTVRPIVESGLYIRSNLEAVCVNCV